MGDFEVTAAMLEAAFGWAAAGLTGVSAGALGAVGGVAMVGGYSIWAAENPEEASQFEQYLADNVVSQDVSGNQQLAMNLQAMPSNLKDSIIEYSASVSEGVSRKPVIPTDINLPCYTPAAIMNSTYLGLQLTFVGGQNSWNNWYTQNQTPYMVTLLAKYSSSETSWNKCITYFFSGHVTLSSNGTYLVARSDEPFSVRYFCNGSTGGPNNVTSYTLSTSSVSSGTFADRTWTISGCDFGLGFQNIGVLGNTPIGLSSAFENYIGGTGTAAEVAVAGGVQAIYLPNIAINNGTVTVDDAYDISGVTYPDIAITIDGGGGTVPVPTDVLTALQQIIGLLTPMGIVSGIPPIVQDIDTKMGAIVDTWPGVMDILDGLGLLPPIVQDIADGIGVIIDIPQSLEDITDILLPIPQSLQGLLDGVTIDIPQTLAQILNGTLSIPTAIDGVISGVAALPAAIAGALDIDWVLENTEELKDRLPDLDAPLILPQASFEDLKDVANDYKERTPLGKIFEAYEGTFEVMSTSPQGAPRYEITFPSPINYTFVIDFAVFDGLFVQLAHAFFYLLAIFWYLKFLKSVKGWVDSWLTFDGKFFHVAGEEAGASWE